MVNKNPDFRGADEVIVPKDALTGWTDGKVSEDEAYSIEQKGFDQIALESPSRVQIKESPSILPDIAKEWAAFQQSKGRYPGSCDWTLLDEFLMGKVLGWLPQIIGSCVVSNSFRGYVIRQQYQIAFLGMAQEYLGRNEFSSNNLSFYGPYTYGQARKIVNMRGGDGLYCEALVKAFLGGKVISCNTPKLLEILKQLGFDRERDFPEPQNANLYRQFGDWRYLDQLEQYEDYGLVDCPFVKSEEDLSEVLSVCKPTFNCSMLAIRKVGEHKDGFAIHGRDPGNAWAHNMCWHGFFYSSDGDKFYRFSNESWGTQHLYNIPAATVSDFFRNRNVTAAAIGEIKSANSTPPVIP